MTPVKAVIERTVAGMGYDLADLEMAGGGLLRVFIDVAGERAASGDFIRVEDCEQVSHQLTHVLMVENVDYARLEVSSPGLDRPLRRPQDFERFVGEEVSVRLRQPLKGRRNFEGVLVREAPQPGDPASGGSEPGTRWALELSPKPAEAARKGAKGRGGKAVATARSSADVEKIAVASPGLTDEAQVVTRLSFTLDEIERARLVPKLKF